MDRITAAPDDELMETNEPTTTTTSGGPGTGRQLTKSSSDRVVAGVAGGLGEYFGVDPVLFRIAFVALSIAGGTGLALYGLGWLLLPDAGDQETPVERVSRWFRQKPVLAVVGTLIALNVVANGFWWGGHWGRGNDGIWGVVLVVLGVAFLVNRNKKGTDPHAPTPGRSPPAATDAGASSGTGDEAPDTGDHDIDPLLAEAAALDPMADTVLSPTTATMWPPSPAVTTPVRIRPRPFLTPVTLSLLLVGAGLTVLLGTSLQVFLAAALIGVGAVMVVGSRWGRARGLLVVGLLLAALATAVSVTDVTFAGGTGTRQYRPIAATQLRPYRLGMGDLTVDVSRLNFEGSRAVKAGLGVGHLTVIVPADVNVVGTAHVGAGQINAFGPPLGDGTSVDRTFTRRAATESGKQLRLDLDVGIGLIDVEVR
jgi:phage shock protein PspC (stress-responsive transcriptional regulator)